MSEVSMRLLGDFPTDQDVGAIDQRQVWGSFCGGACWAESTDIQGTLFI